MQIPCFLLSVTSSLEVATSSCKTVVSSYLEHAKPTALYLLNWPAILLPTHWMNTSCSSDVLLTEHELQRSEVLTVTLLFLAVPQHHYFLNRQYVQYTSSLKDCTKKCVRLTFPVLWDTGLATVCMNAQLFTAWCSMVLVNTRCAWAARIMVLVPCVCVHVCCWFSRTTVMRKQMSKTNALSATSA